METLYKISRDKVAPMLYQFVSWIIRDAQEKEIERLYFLARDGYVLKLIAERICESQGIVMDCRYLYCSRASLRMPAYHFLGNEAYDLIFAGGYNVTINKIYDRVEFNDQERSQTNSELGIDKDYDFDQRLSYKEILKLKEKFKESCKFHEIIKNKSIQAYENAIGYFKQEGLFDSDKVVIVDSGWTGSMQRSIRQLMEKEGYTGNLIGYYFGMFANRKEMKDGEYHCFYFTATSHKCRKVTFCNNLFEIMLSAPHGMTIGYEKDGGLYRAIFDDHISEQYKQAVHEQIKGILNGVDKLSSGKEVNCSGFMQLMSRPKIEDVLAYQVFQFGDDITEKDKENLADFNQLDALNEYMILNKMKRKLFKIHIPEKRKPYWPYGVTAFIRNPIKRLWYRWNIYFHEWLRYTRDTVYIRKKSIAKKI